MHSSQVSNARARLGRRNARALFWLLSTLVLLLCVSRLADLSHLLLWHDEVFTLIRVLGYSQSEVHQALFSGALLSPEQVLRFQQGPAGSLDTTLAALAQHPEHAPLYYLLARAALLLPIEPITAARGASALFAAFLPAAVFWLTHELFGHSPGGTTAPWRDPARWPLPWATALLIAASPMHLLYAQEARQYGLWTVLTVAASAALIHALRTRRRVAWAAYASLMALGLYSHLLFVLTLAVHSAYVLIANGLGLSPLSLRPALRGIPAGFLLAIAAAVLLFLPWIMVALLNVDRLDHYTAWMERPLPFTEILFAWVQHLTRLFIDVTPNVPLWSSLVLVPVLWAILVFLRRAPRPAVWLPALLALTSIAIVLGPDLLFGGSRSQHPRYALPATVAIQIMTAWTLVVGIDRLAPRYRPLARGFLVALIGAGLLSQITIWRADTWWSKNFSAANRAIAGLINQAEAPILLASPSGVATGELVSLAYHLDPRVAIWGEPAQKSQARANLKSSPLPTETIFEGPAEFGSYFALTPSAEVRSAIGEHRLEPIGDSWQWFQRSSSEPAESTASTVVPANIE